LFHSQDTSRRAIWRSYVRLGTVVGVEERALYEDDRKLLFEVLFDIRRLLAQLVDFVEGGDDDGGEEAEETDEP
jgi:hypothetical protein